MNIHVTCKMGCKQICPDSDKKKKKSPKRHTNEAGKKDQGDSTHASQRIGLFTAQEMKAYIDEIKEVKWKAKDKGKKPVAVSLENLMYVHTLWALGEGNFLPATVFASAFRVAFFLVSSDEEFSL